MKVHTRYHGSLEINKEMILSFPNGVPGFPEDKEYIIIALGEGSPFSILQSTQTEELGFVIADPFTFYKEYEFEIPKYITNQLQIEEKYEVLIYSIVTLEESMDRSTINLQAPIIINSKKKMGKQLILNTEKYHTKHSLNTKYKQIGQEG